MSTNKKRKLNLLAESSDVSAFAVRKQLQVAQETLENTVEGTYRTNQTQQLSQEGQSFSNSSIVPSDVSVQPLERGIGIELDQGSSNDELEDDNTALTLDADDGMTKAISSRKSREAQIATQLTTASFGPDNAERFEDGSVLIRIAPGEKLVILGEYGLSVISGQITIHGAILTPSQAIHDVCASLSHSLPVIRCLASNPEKAEIRLHQNKSNLPSLRHLSPLFAGLWSTSSRRLEASDRSEPIPWGLKESSFEILLNQDEVHHLRYHPTVSPPEWNVVLSKTASEWSKNVLPSVTVVCGPKASGKSTFSKLLINRLLTTSTPRGTGSSVAFLDLDPGQPEFSPPGQLSLHLLSKPNFGPPFSHPDHTASGIKLIRAHSIASVSPSSDPDLYSACVRDLFSYYVNMLLPMHSPLVINTLGWILGTGLQLLVDLIRLARPTQVIYMSEDGPREAIESLHNAIKPKPVLTLPSQPTEYLLRTSVHLRTMQYMSYFHRDNTTLEHRVWKLNPITSSPPLEVRYAGKTAGILGVMCLGEQPSVKMLRDTIDGSIVALVVIEDKAAIISSEENASTKRYVENEAQDHGFTNLNSDSQEAAKSLNIENSHQQTETQLILRTPEGIPYLDPTHAEALNPTYSYTIGLALIRGIDTRRQRFQIMTPISPNNIRNIIASGKSIILLRGNLDTPGWAYLETLYKKDTGVTERGKQGESGERTHEMSDVEKGNIPIATDGQGCQVKDFQSSPWVEILEGDKGREAGARVWRVRRDLGKTSEGD